MKRLMKQVNTYSKFFLLTILSLTLSLVLVVTVQAAIMGIGSGAGLSDDSANATPEPIIDAAGRLGAEEFKDLSASFGEAGMEKLAARATAVLKKQPRSGLAHEILGTVAYYQSEFIEAEKHFNKATQLEPAQAGPWLKLGIVQMELNKLALAESALLKALKYQPQNRVANQRLGLLYEYNGEVDKAITHLTNGMQGTRSDYLGVAVNLGRLLNSKQRYGQTVFLLQPRVALDSSLPEAHTILATALLQNGDAKTAEQHFAQALNLEPDNATTHLGYAISLRKADKLSAAEKVINALLAKESKWGVAYLEKADILLAQDKLTEARKTLDLALKVGVKQESVDRRYLNYHLAHKNFVEAKTALNKIIASGASIPNDYVRLSELTRADGGLAGSISVLENGIKAFPESGFLQFRYGSELAANRDYKEAESALAIASKLLPNDLAVLRAYSLTLAKNGNMQTAAEAAEKIYKQKPEKAEALFYATRLQANTQNKEAIALYENILKADENNIVALNNIATAFADEGDLQQAEAFASKANKVLPGNAQLQDTLGWILFQQKRYKDSAELLSAAADSAKDNAKIQYHAGKALEAVGDQRAASAAFSRALELDSKAEWADDVRVALESLH